MEPSFVSLGPDVAAVGMNNRVWFYKIQDGKAISKGDKEFLATIEKVKLNSDYAAVYSKGRATLQLIADNIDGQYNGREQRHFPDKEDDNTITSIDITQDFFIYATSKGSIIFFSLNDWNIVNE